MLLRNHQTCTDPAQAIDNTGARIQAVQTNRDQRRKDTATKREITIQVRHLLVNFSLLNPLVPESDNILFL
jgi:hypothetical protein